MPRELINEFGIPEIFFRAAKQDSHTVHGDVSVTELIDAPQIRYLKKHYTYQEDVSSLVWALLGTGVHHVLEQSQPQTRKARQIYNFIAVLQEMKDDGDLGDDKHQKVDRMVKFIEDEILSQLPDSDMDRFDLEKSLTMDWNGYVISGTRDVMDHEEKKISDYKVTSAMSYMYPEPIKKWTAQMNVYKILSEANGEEVENLEVLAIFKDWKANDYKRLKGKGYPPNPIMEVPLDVAPRDQMERYISQKVEDHKAADRGEPRECNEKERWKESDVYAVMPESGKKSLKNFNDKEYAQQYLEAQQMKMKQKLYLEHRPGKNKRCENFCPVRDVCPQYARMKD
jgi:hypothetical protein